MKIAVVGCGALGSFYGAKLCAAGHEVHFLLRSDYEAVRRAGVQVHSVDGDFHTHPMAAKDPHAIGVCELVLIGLKTTANGEFPKLIPPLVGPGTVVITLQNGLGNEEALAKLLGPDRILGGRCFLCSNRVAPGVIEHTAHGDILLSEFQGPPQARTRQFAEIFQKAGIRCQVTDSLGRTHWEKLLWNIPFNGLGVAGCAGYEAVIAGHVPASTPIGPCLPTDQLLADPRWASLVRALMLEVIAAAEGQGFTIPQSAVEDRIERTRRMGAYKASTLIDFECGRALELESMFLEPLRRARAAGISTPRLQALCQVLAELDPARKQA